jgi:hypothetical protein
MMEGYIPQAARSFVTRIFGGIYFIITLHKEVEYHQYRRLSVTVLQVWERHGLADSQCVC